MVTQRLTCSRVEESKRDCHEISLVVIGKTDVKPLSSDRQLSSHFFLWYWRGNRGFAAARQGATDGLCPQPRAGLFNGSHSAVNVSAVCSLPGITVGCLTTYKLS